MYLHRQYTAYTSVSKLTIQGLYPALKMIMMMFTALETVDLSSAETPSLGEIDFSYSKLNQIKLPMVTNSLY